MNVKVILVIVATLFLSSAVMAKPTSEGLIFIDTD